MLFTHFYWKLFGRPDVPPRGFTVTGRINSYTGRYSESKRHLYAHKYNEGLEVEQIAKLSNVTRERVRQCLWKAYWESYDRR